MCSLPPIQTCICWKWNKLALKHYRGTWTLPDHMYHFNIKPFDLCLLSKIYWKFIYIFGHQRIKATSYSTLHKNCVTVKINLLGLLNNKKPPKFCHNFISVATISRKFKPKSNIFKPHYFCYRSTYKHVIMKYMFLYIYA